MPVNLCDIIDRLNLQVGVISDFTKGDATVTIVGTNGSYPSLAKLVHDSQLIIDNLAATSQVTLINLINQLTQLTHASSGLIGKKYTFTNTTKLIVNHNVGSIDYTYRIIDDIGDTIIAADTIIDSNNFSIDFTTPVTGTILITFFINI